MYWISARGMLNNPENWHWSKEIVFWLYLIWGLWFWFEIEGVKDLEMHTREALKCCSQSQICDSGQNSEDQTAARNRDNKN